MKRLLLGSLLSCMLVGQVFSNDYDASPRVTGALKGFWGTIIPVGSLALLGSGFGAAAAQMRIQPVPMRRYALPAALTCTAISSFAGTNGALKDLYKPARRMCFSSGRTVELSESSSYNFTSAVTNMSIFGISIGALLRMALRK